MSADPRIFAAVLFADAGAKDRALEELARELAKIQERVERGERNAKAASVIACKVDRMREWIERQ